MTNTESQMTHLLSLVVATASTINYWKGWHYLPYFAIDGKNDFTRNGFFFSRREHRTRPWLQLDFGTPQSITGVTLYARKDYCRRCLGSGTVSVGDKRAIKYRVSQNPACGNWRARGDKGSKERVNCRKPMTGRYVIFQKSTKGILQIQEIQLHPGSTALGLFKGISGCMDCRCNSNGRSGTSCTSPTGQCKCKSIACGLKCEKKTCDAEGAYSTCVPWNHKCKCKAGFCGPRCEHKSCGRNAVSQCIAKGKL